MHHGGGGVDNKGYEGDGHLKNQRPSCTNSIQREKVKLRRSEKWRILKNIAIVSFAFMVQFTAFQVGCVFFLEDWTFLNKSFKFLGHSKLTVIN